MQYLGGKTRVVKQLAPILREQLARVDGRFVEPFVGGFNIIPEIHDSISTALCSDVHVGMITLYHALVNGWNPPEELSEEEYQILRDTGDWTDPMSAFAAFGCSFGGKEWGGFARNNQGTNYAAQAARSLRRKVEAMGNVQFLRARFQDEQITDHIDERPCLVYCDPPYIGTTRYGANKYRTTRFNSFAFYRWCEERAARGAKVLVSEFHDPSREGWNVIWTKERAITTGKSKNTYKRKTELLLEVR